MSERSNGEGKLTTSPRIGQVAREEAVAFSERYTGYRDDLVSALDSLVRQQSYTTPKQRQEHLQKVVEKLGAQAINLGRDDA